MQLHFQIEMDLLHITLTHELLHLCESSHKLQSVHAFARLLQIAQVEAVVEMVKKRI